MRGLCKMLPDRIELPTSEWQAQEKAASKTALGRFANPDLIRRELD